MLLAFKFPKELVSEADPTLPRYGTDLIQVSALGRVSTVTR